MPEIILATRRRATGARASGDRGSAASDEVYDLDVVSRSERGLSVLLRANDAAIHFDRDALAREVEVPHQVCDRVPGRDGPCIAIQGDVHFDTLGNGRYLYNLNPVW